MVTAMKIIYSSFVILYHWLEAIVLFFTPKRLRYKDVSNDIVLITGGGSGLGRLLAVKFARRNAKIVVWDIIESNLNETKRMIEENGGTCAAYVCDVSKRDEVYKTAERVRKEIGDVTILVNNAGIVNGKKFLDLEDEKMIKTLNVNTFAHFWTCKAFLPAMRQKRRGHIVTIASVLGLSSAVSVSDYVASKFAAVGFHGSLSLETYFDGFPELNFTLVCPYMMNTGMFGGVKTDILPALDPEVAAENVMSAILTNQEFLIIPRLLYVTYVMHTLMPLKCFKIIFELFNGPKAMDTYVGKKEKKNLNDKKIE
ncbi:Short-chain dehydrogenase/reductase family 16C member 6-like protein [Dinothrombium tinctorium]|uniref:Short-chain dehydrogenase/reductase 3 n=1 Tax=Dinothrombium tinctorium TaxID=1965070 RepID=A0A443QWI3_9ACAR|nr:Short-chain dehydrogenase/reductase family 16C member 6-like protein [Dinothrombium tinctorium]